MPKPHSKWLSHLGTDPAISYPPLNLSNVSPFPPLTAVRALEKQTLPTIGTTVNVFILLCSHCKTHPHSLVLVG